MKVNYILLVSVSALIFTSTLVNGNVIYLSPKLLKPYQFTCNQINFDPINPPGFIYAVGDQIYGFSFEPLH